MLASLCSELIVSILSNISLPWQSLVARFLYDLQVSHLGIGIIKNCLHTTVVTNLNTRGGKVWNLKLDMDGRFSLSQVTIHTGQEELGLHEVFLAPWE